MKEDAQKVWIDSNSQEETQDISSTPEELRWSQKEIQNAKDELQTWKKDVQPWSLEYQNIVRRENFLENMLSKISDFLSIGSESGDMAGNQNVIETAKKYLDIDEKTGEADKFLMGMAKSAKETPWCAGFVSYVLWESGYKTLKTLSSKAFIGESGKWHVAFYAGNKQMLGGNQDNRVSIKPINRPIQWWIMPEELEWKKTPHQWGTPPIWAIVVFNRGWSDKSMA